MRTAIPGAIRTLVAGGLFLLASTAQSHAQSLDVVIVEENWEMTINQPDALINSPQVSFFAYPDSDCSDCYFQLQLNYAAEEGYSSGGFRVAAVSNEVSVDEERSVVREMLTIDNDHIQWTSAFAAIDGKLMYAVKNGTGTEWGNFGGPDYLVEMENHGVFNLNHYSAVKSTDSVDMVFGANRIQSIRLKSVRLTYSDGHSETFSINRYVKQVLAE